MKKPANTASNANAAPTTTNGLLTPVVVTTARLTSAFAAGLVALTAVVFLVTFALLVVFVARVLAVVFVVFALAVFAAGFFVVLLFALVVDVDLAMRPV